jgi:predicted porin
VPSRLPIFGVVDEFLVVHHTAGQDFTRLDNSGLMASRFGFLGTEALGARLKANFVLSKDSMSTQALRPSFHGGMMA